MAFNKIDGFINEHVPEGLMLSIIREHADSWMIKAILWLIIFAFIGTIFYSWGMGGSSGSSGGVIASVNGEKIRQGEYERTFNNLVDFYRQQFKSQFSNDMIKKLDLKNQSLEALIQKKILLLEAGKQNIQVSNEEVISYIKKIPAFQSNKKFSEPAYRNYIKSQRLTPGEFEETQRETLLLDKLEKIFRTHSKASKSEVLKEFRNQEDKVKLEYVRFTNDNFISKTTISDQALKDYFQANKAKFEIPPQIRVQYVKVEPKKYQSEIEPREEDIEEYYQTKIANFNVKKKYKASHILTSLKPSDIEGDITEKQKQADEKAKLKSNELLGRLNKGADFSEVAKKHSDDPASGANGGSLGEFPEGTMVSAFENALDKLKPGEISKPVLSPFGYHIIKLESMDKKRIKPLSEVKDEIIESLKEIKARQRVKRIIKRIHQAAQQDGNLSKAAEGHQLQTAETDFFSRENHILLEIGNQPDFFNTAFSLEKNKVSEPIITPEVSFVIKVTEEKPKYIPELSEVLEKATEALTESNNEAATLKKFEELKENLARDKDLEKLVKGYDISIRNTPFFSKAESIPGIGNISQIKEKAFTMKAGEFSSAKVRDRFYLYRLADIEKSGEPDSEQIKKITNKIKIEKSRQAFQEWIENLKTGAEILVDKSLL
ncbi:MAG: peptidyl-prolyl cis-trans isomerase D [Nitrospinales bacterium]